MHRLIAILVALAATLTTPDTAEARDFTFAGIEGGTLSLSDYAGRPVLVVNTASRCAFTRQYDALQTLYDQYREAGLVVLAVPSNDFRQELESAEAVQDFCEVNFGLDLPMTDITVVTGPEAHPFFRWLATEHGFAPRWNFNKVLLDGEGMPVATFGSRDQPDGRAITSRIEAMVD